MMQRLIECYKRMRTAGILRQTYQYQYAFVGMGQHSLTNLYPVLHYLGVPLKYICVTSPRKAALIGKKYPGVQATTRLEDVLEDAAVRGVFVSASPSAHFALASKVLQSGKALFIEKPPCQTVAKLDTLIQQSCSVPVMVGLQRRYAPAVQLLKKRLTGERLISYDLHELMGSYPEGNALLDLYIHPLDLVVQLFGKPKVIACRKTAKDSYLLMLQHPHIIGTLELSTAYSWTDAEATLKVHTASGTYHLSDTEALTFTPHPPSVYGIPLEKICPHHKTVEHLHNAGSIVPILTNNPVYTQGYFNEISAFVNMVEKREKERTDLASVRGVYELMMEIKEKATSYASAGVQL